MGSKRLAGTLVLCVVLAALSLFADGPDPTVKASTPPPRRPREPILASVDRAIEEVLDAHERPCVEAQQAGIPCFPVTVKGEGPRFSVADALRRFRAEGKAPGGPPTNAEMQQQLMGPHVPASGSVSFDPGCAVKSLVRLIGGGGNTFYLYRLQDRFGVRPMLTDHRLSRDQLAAMPQVRDLMGSFSGECAAIAAWRKALRAEAAAARADPSP